jgi:hypothetical protein
LDLKRAATGLGFDVVKGTITSSDEWWEEKISVGKLKLVYFLPILNPSYD